MTTRSRTMDMILAEIGTRDHGVVARSELLAEAISDARIQRRVASGGLLLEYPGVWRVGHRAASVEADYMAAVKAGPSDALIAGAAAGWAWRLVKAYPPPPPQIVSSRPCRLPGLHARRCRGLTYIDGARWKGIPITTVPRTLVDLAGAFDLDALARACHEAGVLHRTTPAHVKRVIARRPNVKGAGKLRIIMDGDSPVLLSKLERGYIAVLRANGLPMPVTNKPASGRRVDCRWPAKRLTVELDSYRFHSSRYAWEQDHRRAREAYKRGDEFRRYMWSDVFERPSDMLTELRGLLA